VIEFTGTSITITINYNHIKQTGHNRWLSKTRSIAYWITIVFSSTVTDLVLIYESVTSSASVVLWLTLYCWTLNSLTNDFEWTHELTLLHTSGWTEERSPPRTVRLLLFISSVATKCVCQSRGNALISTKVFVATKRVFSEPFSSTGLFCHDVIWYGKRS
jgi:hypothetical protein